MEAKRRADELLWYAEQYGYDKRTSIDMVLFAVDKIINYGNIDRTEESFYCDVMDQLERMRP